MNERTSRYHLRFWILNAGTAILRLLLIGRIGLSGDESHYWAYSRFPDLSYFDHPPLIGYLIKFSTSLFGATEFAVRLPAVLLFFFTSYLVYRIAARLYDERVAFWSVALLNATPVFSFLGAVLTIPDAPLAFFWVLYIFLVLKIIETGKQGYWYLSGAVLGLGLLSKYNAVLLVPSVFIFLALSKEHRRWLARPGPWLSLVIAGALFLPVIVWNLETGGASFGYQLQHGFGKTAPSFSLSLLGRSLGAQAGYLSPVLFVLFWLVLALLVVRALRGREERPLFLASFTVPILLLFNAIASFNEILPHWPAMGYLLLAIPVAAFTLEHWHKGYFKTVTVTGWALGIALTVLVPLQALYKLLPPELFLPRAEAARIEDGITKAEKVDVTNEMYGWGEVGKKIADIIERSPGPKPFVFTHRHYIASQLSFYVPGLPRIYCLSERLDAYDFWQRDLGEIDGRDGIFVTSDYFHVEPETIYPFASWERYPVLEVYRSGRKVRLFWITYGRKFDAKKLSPEYRGNERRLTFPQALRALDYRLFWLINKDLHFRPLDDLMALVTKVDSGLGINTGLLFLVGLIGIVLRVTRRERFWPEFLLAIGIIVLGGILVNIIKDIVGRHRPLSIFGEQVCVFHERLYNGSFPSGHSQIAFSVATYLTLRLRKYWWLFFLLAVFIGLSRVYVGVHFPIDVAAGAFIGVLTTLIIVNLVKV